MIKRFFGLLLIAVLFSYCKRPTEFKEIEVNNLYSLQIPVYLRATDDLLPITAPNIQQYKDSDGKVCLLVFDTARAGFDVGSLKRFYDSMVVSLVLDSAKVSVPQLIKIDNDSTYKSEITGLLNKSKVFSEIEVIATKDRYFSIQMFSGISKPEQLKPDMDKMLNSFHDISHLKK